MATNPDCYAIWAVFIGGGGGLQFVDNTCSPDQANPCRSSRSLPYIGSLVLWMTQLLSEPLPVWAKIQRGYPQRGWGKTPWKHLRALSLSQVSLLRWFRLIDEDLPWPPRMTPWSSSRGSDIFGTRLCWGCLGVHIDNTAPAEINAETVRWELYFL